MCNKITRFRGITIHIDGRPKALRNIVGFIKNTRPKTTKKPANCVLKGHEGNWVVVCAIESIAAGEESLRDYDLNQIDTGATIMG